MTNHRQESLDTGEFEVSYLYCSSRSANISRLIEKSKMDWLRLSWDMFVNYVVNYNEKLHYPRAKPSVKMKNNW